LGSLFVYIREGVPAIIQTYPGMMTSFLSVAFIGLNARPSGLPPLINKDMPDPSFMPGKIITLSSGKALKDSANHPGLPRHDNRDLIGCPHWIECLTFKVRFY